MTARQELAELRERLARVEALFAGGPDTACRTTWPGGVECVEVPMAELRAALAPLGTDSGTIRVPDEEGCCLL
jgi:hypothetical protein